MASQYTIQECNNGYVLTHSYSLSIASTGYVKDTYVFKYAQELTRKLEELMAGD